MLCQLNDGNNYYMAKSLGTRPSQIIGKDDVDFRSENLITILIRSWMKSMKPHHLKLVKLFNAG